MVHLSLLVLIPLSAVFVRSLGLGWDHFWDAVTEPRVLASLRLSFWASLLAALINAIFGLVVSWVLVRYTFMWRSTSAVRPPALGVPNAEIAMSRREHKIVIGRK